MDLHFNLRERASISPAPVLCRLAQDGSSTRIKLVRDNISAQAADSWALARPSLASGIAESPGRDVGLAESGFRTCLAPNAFGAMS
jgi:hypothetical protein